MVNLVNGHLVNDQFGKWSILSMVQSIYDQFGRWSLLVWLIEDMHEKRKQITKKYEPLRSRVPRPVNLASSLSQDITLLLHQTFPTAI